MTDMTEWRLPDDEVGERTSEFVARIILEDNADVSAVGAALQQRLHEGCNAVPGGYIWYREPPALQIGVESFEGKGLTLSMRVQDAVEDEWFLTYILRDASHALNACVSVEDEDGEFLLIEAADTLPSWICPENAKNRVWLFDGALHLVPLEYTSQDKLLSVRDATCLVRNPQIHTLASERIQKAALARINEYPEAARVQHHTTLAYLPPAAARAFTTYPQLVADSIHALATRDVLSTRAAQKPTYIGIEASEDEDMSYDKPPCKNSSLYQVRMTRHLYAQLSFDRFFPPRSYGLCWQRAVELYRIATTTSARRESITPEQALFGRWCDTGAKLTAGLEMRLHILGVRVPNQGVPLASIDRDRLIASLNTLGYFGDEVVGSQQWQALEAQAIETAGRLQAGDNGNEHGTFRSIRRAMSEGAAAPVNSYDAHEDSDEWLSMAPEELEQMFAKYHGAPSDAEEAAMNQLGKFMEKMQSFVEGEGDAEGALFNDELSDDSDDSEHERRKNTLVAPLSPSEWGAGNVSQQSESQLANSLKENKIGADATSIHHKPGESSVLLDERLPTRLRGLSTQEHYDGHSDSEVSFGDDEGIFALERQQPLEVAEDDLPEEHVMDDFFEFTRRQLGLSESQYARILDDRRARGGM